MRLALAQINPLVGDVDHNAALIARWVEQARAAGADLVVLPELCLTGYPPKDLLLQHGFLRAVDVHAERLCAEHSAGITVVFGLPMALDVEAGGVTPLVPGRITNSLVACRDGVMVARYDKRLLPTYDVFDENRYFTPGGRSVVIDVAGVRVGLSVCEDLWFGMDAGFGHRYAGAREPIVDLVGVQADGGAGAEVIVNPSASPFVLGKGHRQREILRSHAVKHGVHVAAVNQVGGNDELIFDGHAAVVSPRGELIAAGPGFVEGLTVVDVDPRSAAAAPRVTDPIKATVKEELLYRALVLGIRDYARKTGFSSAVLGLSGGIDSAVTAVLAAAALGPSRVLGASMPSRYSSAGSKDDAWLLAEALGLTMHTIPIEDAFEAFEATMKPAFAGRPSDVAEENLQSRVRGTILMALSNKFGHLLLTTGNKSELAVGYCTLYGDMNGGLAVLSDVFKEAVYGLARWMNANPAKLGIEGLRTPPIPAASITKAPSAELRPNQTDQDSLPPYPVLDEIIERYVERRESRGEIIAGTGFDPSVVSRVLRMIDLAEYKRKQSPLGLKVTGVAFGSGRRMPIAQGWRGA